MSGVREGGVVGEMNGMYYELKNQKHFRPEGALCVPVRGHGTALCGTVGTHRQKRLCGQGRSWLGFSVLFLFF